MGEYPCDGTLDASSIVLRPPVQPVAEALAPAPEKTEGTGRFAKIAGHAGAVLAAAAVAAEMAPITNESVRAAALMGTQDATHNSLLSTGVWAGLTFAIEAAGAVSAAYLVNQPYGAKALAKADKLLSKPNKRGRWGEAWTALAFGSAVSTIAHHRKRGKHSMSAFGDDARSGLLTAAGVTAMTAPIGYGLVEGMAESVVDTLNTGMLAATGAYVVYALAKRGWARYTRPGRHRAPEPALAA